MVKLTLQQTFSFIQNWTNAWKSVDLFVRNVDKSYLKHFVTPAVPRCVFLQHFPLAKPRFHSWLVTWAAAPHYSFNLAREHYSRSPSLLLRVTACMPRHQPEPYIRRRATPASSPRHTFLFFCLFSFFCFLTMYASCVLSSFI